MITPVSGTQSCDLSTFSHAVSADLGEQDQVPKKKIDG